MLKEGRVGARNTCLSELKSDSLSELKSDNVTVDIFRAGLVSNISEISICLRQKSFYKVKHRRFLHFDTTT
jgi:hypothetical protein